MRRMYSKEQLQKLIDEVSRLIAVEELDKVVPVPTLADAGKVMIVNAQGTGYQLAEAQPTLLEDIEDSDGHKRFIEGSITTIAITGVSYSYAKWSLCGTHLMIVLAFSLEAGATMPEATLLGTLSNVPQWLRDKIYPSGDTEKQVCVKYADEWLDNNNPQEQHIYGGLQKSPYLQIAKWGATYTPANKTYFRLAFDLLIDNE